ncbi:MAG: DUF1232 domain-containing protein [Bacteroidaceae bacterium]|nr:DUF1232 domain-containing protein [Bacteroidaceae bacterium]
MKKRVLAFFSRGRWLQLAAQYIAHPKKLQELLTKVSQYAGRKGLEKVGGNIKLLWHYVSDVATRRYTDYNTHALLLIIAGLIYLVTPVDFLPDFIVGGLIDDVSVILYIVQSVREELQRYENNRCNKPLQE